MTGLIKGADKKIIYKDADKEIKTRVKILGLSTQILFILFIVITIAIFIAAISLQGVSFFDTVFQP